ncbi:hypothetical protein J8M20_02575 [Pseudoalteromonas luteoviolacea]|uniref:hypothetical protein n=1 Tax=Pseudoalteromonas luteoviolacea TaxID=43657 RepID=UPI001B382F67|nr:hypothetical protein [Pseudoalteromonas luteoviolacea]MBQ4810198.1 hypothetical protein [Pseudoalteromonas luteoviolacea]
MKKSLLCFIFSVLVIAFLIVFNYADSASVEHVTHVQSPVKEQHEARHHNQDSTEKFEPIYDGERVEALIKKLADADIKELKPFIESFWQSCSLRSECDDLLMELQNQLSFSKYQLIAEYPAKQREFNQLTESEGFNTSTVEKVERIKNIYTQVWGDSAAELFHEAFSFYDARATLAELTAMGNKLEQSEFLAQLTTLGQQGKIPASKNEQYSIAIELLSANMDPSELSQLKSQLAQHYFSPLKANAILARQNQVVEQQKAVKSYHHALNKKKAKLQMDRRTALSHLSEQQWQSHYTAEIKAFRKAFFNE